jgi:RNA-directed DNA polymerase
VGKRVVLRIDLHDFFPSISVARIQALFRTVGYPERVAEVLAGLCTNSTPLDAWEGDTPALTARQTRQARWLYSQPHLPQGAPTSPAHCQPLRLSTGLPTVRVWRTPPTPIYTRYADDLVFSSGDANLERVVRRFHLHVCATVMEEGFSVHHRKTRIMRQGVRQRLTGIGCE